MFNKRFCALKKQQDIRKFGNFLNHNMKHPRQNYNEAATRMQQTLPSVQNHHTSKPTSHITSNQFKPRKSIEQTNLKKFFFKIVCSEKTQQRIVSRSKLFNKYQHTKNLYYKKFLIRK